MNKSAIFLVSLIALALPDRAVSATAYDSLAENYAKWKAVHPARYAYTFYRGCFCAVDSVRVEVDGDSVVKAAFKNNVDVPGPTLRAPQYYSPDSIFARIKEELDRNPSQYEIRYDSLLGYPEMASFDPQPMVADDEYTDIMVEFQDLTVNILNRPQTLQVRPDLGHPRDLLGRSLRSGIGPVFRLPSPPAK